MPTNELRSFISKTIKICVLCYINPYDGDMNGNGEGNQLLTNTVLRKCKFIEY